MRLFVAVNICKENKNKIGRVQSVLKKSASSADIKWVEPKNLHITLKFLGEVKDEKIALVSEKLKRSVAGIKKFEIDFEEIGVFPGESFPRVLWLGMSKGAAETENLAKEIENLLTEAGFEKEKRPFAAHLTLGRFKSPKNSEKLFEAVKKLPPEKMSDIVDVVNLMKSTLTPDGPVYDVVEKYQLEDK